MSAVILDDRIVHYEVLGRGRPIIFLHGWVGSWRYWVPTMQAAAMSFRAYALDLWGFGDTAHDPACYTLPQQVDLLDRFMMEMGIGKVALIGHGLGALTAILFARKFPQVVDRLMAVNVPMDGSSVASRMRSPASPADLADWLLGKGPVTEPARVDAPKADLNAITASFTSLNNTNILPIMDSMATPCLIVHGQNDPAIRTLEYDRFMSMPVLVYQIVLENSGHFPMLDEGPRFNRLMTDFLALDSGESPRELQLKEEWKRRVR
ncbi:MAG TPA: alpha/beta hydrolase [Anaerolineales bacterium]|nr:alpha/beta hydrolase [Anaerolineales bacterium]